MSLRILNAEPLGYSPRAAARLVELGELVQEAVPVGRLVDRVAAFDALIVRLAHSVDAAILAAGAAGRLRAVVTATTGLDHIELEAASEHGVEVLSLRGEVDFLRTIRATAEHTWALLLALVRKLPWAFDSVCRGEWRRDDYRGGELAGRRLGILGLGRLGEQVARYGRVFGMEVAAFDPYREDWLEGVRRCGSQRELAVRSDVLSIHLPLDASTRGSVDRQTLEALPEGALVVNTARGPLLDEAALVELLDRGHLGGAALDVMCGEVDDETGGRREASPLLAHLGRSPTPRNLVLTPHIGGATWESMHRTEEFMAEKLCRFLGSATCESGGIAR